MHLDDTPRLDTLAPPAPVDPATPGSLAAPLDPPPSGPRLPTRSAEVTADLPAPRVRWAGIVWGVVLAAVAASALWIFAVPSRYAPMREWMLTLAPESIDPGVVAAVALLVVGLLLVITGGIALLRRLTATP